MPPPADLTVEELSRRFAAEGFDLGLRTIGARRWLAVAANPDLGGAGPAAMGDTPAGAARLGWARFEAHRDHYLRPLDPDSADPGGGTALRRLRRARGFSQRQLAAAASVSVTTINRLELDRQAVPTMPTRTTIARALGTSVGDVFPDLPR